MIIFILVMGVEYFGDVSEEKLCLHLQVGVVSRDHGPSHAITTTNNRQVRVNPNVVYVYIKNISKYEVRRKSEVDLQ